MPSATHTAEAIRNVRVAITALDVVRGWPSALARQRAISVARHANDWEAQQGHALYPGLAGNAFIENGLRKGAPCTICGSLCPHLTAKKYKQISAAAVQTGSAEA